MTLKSNVSLLIVVFNLHQSLYGSPSLCLPPPPVKQLPLQLVGELVWAPGCYLRQDDDLCILDPEVFAKAAKSTPWLLQRRRARDVGTPVERTGDMGLTLSTA